MECNRVDFNFLSGLIFFFLSANSSEWELLYIIATLKKEYDDSGPLLKGLQLLRSIYMITYIITDVHRTMFLM